jgi:hypothetical protein
MNAKQIFEEMLKDPILNQKYELSESRINGMSLHGPSGSEIVEVIKFVVNGIENDTPDSSIYSQIAAHFHI